MGGTQGYVSASIDVFSYSANGCVKDWVLSRTVSVSSATDGPIVVASDRWEGVGVEQRMLGGDLRLCCYTISRTDGRQLIHNSQTPRSLAGHV